MMVLQCCSFTGGLWESGGHFKQKCSFVFEQSRDWRSFCSCGSFRPPTVWKGDSADSHTTHIECLTPFYILSLYQLRSYYRFPAISQMCSYSTLLPNVCICACLFYSCLLHYCYYYFLWTRTRAQWVSHRSKHMKQNAVCSATEEPKYRKLFLTDMTIWSTRHVDSVIALSQIQHTCWLFTSQQEVKWNHHNAEEKKMKMNIHALHLKASVS